MVRTKRPNKPTLFLLALAGSVWLPASAEGQLGPDGSPINTSNYTVDLTRGVVISTSRVVGLSGAATSLAQGVEGGLQNPAAVAYRGPAVAGLVRLLVGLRADLSIPVR